MTIYSYDCIRRVLVLAVALVSSTFSLSETRANPITLGELTLDGALKSIGLTADLYTLFGIGGFFEATNKLSLTVNGDDENFFLTLVGGAVKSDHSFDFAGLAKGSVTPTATGDFWLYNFTLELDDHGLSAINDEMSINGFVQHVIGPHPGTDLQFGPQLKFNVHFNSDTAVGGVFSGVGNGQVKTDQHLATHWDGLSKVDLSGTVSSGGLFGEVDDITGFTFQLEDHHTPVRNPSLPTVPEPSFSLGLLVFAMGVLLLAHRVFNRNGVHLH